MLDYIDKKYFKMAISGPYRETDLDIAVNIKGIPNDCTYFIKIQRPALSALMAAAVAKVL